MTAPARSPNQSLLRRVAEDLGVLIPEVVFVGGQVVELIVTDAAIARIRPTDDVDVVVEIATRTEYERFSERLRQIGFRVDSSEGAPLCRWLTPRGHKVDVMASEEAVFGHSTRWFREVLESAVAVQLEAGPLIRIPSAPVFLATKWSAFHDRGGGDVFGSQDIQDIITVVAGRRSIVDEVLRSRPDLRSYIAVEAGRFLALPEAKYVLEGALPDARYDDKLVSRTAATFEALADVSRDR